jgi:uncharacterized protein DUF222
MGASAARSSVRTARALFRGPLQATAAALTAGEVSVAQASVLAAGTHDLPHHRAADAEPVLVEAARRLDPPRLRRAVVHLRQTIDPEAADAQADRPEAGQTLLAALDPLTRPANAQDPRSGSQRRADALTELARRSLEAGQLPQTGGVRPQLAVIVDLDSLQGHPGTAAVGGEVGWAGPLGPEACRRLACDGAVTRVLVTRQHPGHDHGHGLGDQHDHHHRHHGPHGHDPDGHSEGDRGLAARLQAARALLPPILGGAPSPPLDLGRTTRVITPANGPPWPSATAAACSPTVTGRWPGAKAITWCIGWMAAPPTWPIWSCCAGPTIGPSMTAAGS